MTAPDRGDRLPVFTLPADGGREISAADLRGAPLVLYFYPRDNTSGCTREAEQFRDLYDAFRAAGAEVVGVSRDSVRKHDSFKKKVGIPFPLLSDGEGDLCQAMGVWTEKSMYGKTHMGIERSTFLVDGEGVIRDVWRKVKVPGHAEAVLAALKEVTGA